MGAVSLGLGIILRWVWHFSGPVAGPFGTGPMLYYAFSLVCFVAAIAYCQVFILTAPKE